jgi:hypothetical protein
LLLTGDMNALRGRRRAKKVRIMQERIEKTKPSGESVRGPEGSAALTAADEVARFSRLSKKTPGERATADFGIEAIGFDRGPSPDRKDYFRNGSPAP